MTSVFTVKELYDLSDGQLKVLANYLGVEGDTKDELVKTVYESLNKQPSYNAFSGEYEQPEVKVYSIRVQRIMDSIKGE